MAGASVTVTVDDRAFREDLALLKKRSSNLQPAFDEIGASLLTSTQQRFEEEKDPEGEPWQKLSESYQKSVVSRSKKGKKVHLRGGDHILREQGNLFRSITYLATAENAAIGTNRIYAAIHQFGGSPDMRPGPAGIPARPFLGLSAEDEREVHQILLDHLELAAS